jgi:hypothetical protein
LRTPAARREARNLGAMHERDHERKRISAEIKIYRLPPWRRYVDTVGDDA